MKLPLAQFVKIGTDIGYANARKAEIEEYIFKKGRKEFRP